MWHERKPDFNLPSVSYYKIGEGSNYHNSNWCCDGGLGSIVEFVDKEGVYTNVSGSYNDLYPCRFCPKCGNEPILINTDRNIWGERMNAIRNVWIK